MPVDLAAVRRLARVEQTRRAAAAYLDEWEAEFERAVIAAFRSAFAPALERFGSAVVAAGEPGPASPDDLAVIRTAWAAEVDAVLAPLVATMFDTGALSALLAFEGATERRRRDDLLDSLDDVLDRNALSWLDDARNRLVGIGDTAWEVARAELVEGFVLGESIDDLSARIEHALGVAENRAVTIARTEVVSASNAGSYSGVRALGSYGPDRKQWLATVDARTRPSHVDADGQVVDMDGSFAVGAASLAFPGDPSGPADEVINCRCTILYVEEGDEPHDLDAPGRGQGDGTPSSTPEQIAASSDPEETTMTTRARAVRTATGFTIPPPPRYAEDDPPVTEEPTEAVEAPEDLVVEVPAGANLVPFEVVVAVEGRWTGDDRFVLPGAIRWDGMLPMPVDIDHEETVDAAIGWVGELARVPGAAEGESFIVGRGFFDLGPEDRPFERARDVVDRLRNGHPLGASMSIDDQTLGGVDPTSVEEGDDAWWMNVVEDLRIRALTVAVVGAFAECRWSLDPEGVTLTELPPAPTGPRAVSGEEARAIEEALVDEANDLVDEVGGVVIVADGGGYRVVAAAPRADAPPAEWFEDPALDGPTPLTVTEDGRVFGHIATWGTCHTGFAGQCITPPHSRTGYAMFHTGEVLTREGQRVPVGRITAGTGHASTRLSAVPAAAHYDDTGHAVADVAAGEDRFGIYVAGAVRASSTPEQVETLRASPPSGDWRRIGGGMELVAALAVNSPGFPVPRVRIASGQPEALVAANVIDTTARPKADPALTAAAARIASTVGRDPATRAAELRRRVHGEAK